MYEAYLYGYKEKHFMGDNPVVLTFSVLFLLLLKESNLFCVFFLCPCRSKKVCFSVSTIAKIKCQDPSWVFLDCNTYSEYLKSAQHFLVHENPNFVCNSYEPAKFTEVATFHPL
jgi:hypothetical protein